jgi:predicted transcriptional regulator
MARLGDLERKVMNVLWDDPNRGLTVRQVAERLPGYAYTTVLTVLDRLEDKGLVNRTKDGRAFSYRAAGSRGDFTAQLMREALEGSCDREAVLVRFAQTVGPDEADSLRRALKPAEG